MFSKNKWSEEEEEELSWGIVKKLGHEDIWFEFYHSKKQDLLSEQIFLDEEIFIHKRSHFKTSLFVLSNSTN